MFTIWATWVKPWWGNLYQCDNPQSLPLSSLSYSTAQSFWGGINYVEGTCLSNGVTVDFKAVIDSNTWEILPNRKAEWLYSRQSALIHSWWQEASIWSGTIIGWTAEIIVCWWFNPPAQASQTFTFTWPSEVNKDDNAIYTLVFSNAWPDVSQDTVITLPLPSWVSYVSDDWGWSESGWVVTWNLWDYLAWQSITIQLTLSHSSAGSKSLVATLADSLTSTSNIVRTVNVDVLSADLSVSVGGDSTPGIWVNTIQTVTVTNNWPTDANGCEVVLTLPSEIDRVSWGSYNAWTREITLSYWNVPVGSSNINVTLNLNSGWTINIPVVVSATTPDWNPLNNSTTRTLTWAQTPIPGSLDFFVFDSEDGIWYIKHDIDNGNKPIGYVDGEIYVEVQFPAWTTNVTSSLSLSNYSFSFDAWTRIATIEFLDTFSAFSTSSFLRFNGNGVWWSVIWSGTMTATLFITGKFSNSTPWSAVQTAVSP